MINYEDCLNYIENVLPGQYSSIVDYENHKIPSPITLSDSQKKFLKNLIEGKITNCPRNMGKTFVIRLYADYLDYVTNMCKYDDIISPDDRIGVKDTIEFGLLNKNMVTNHLKENKEKAMKEYCISEGDLEYFNN